MNHYMLRVMTTMTIRRISKLRRALTITMVPNGYGFMVSTSKLNVTSIEDCKKTN
jgi:hypothetical protein